MHSDALVRVDEVLEKREGLAPNTREGSQHVFYEVVKGEFFLALEPNVEFQKLEQECFSPVYLAFVGYLGQPLDL